MDELKAKIPELRAQLSESETKKTELERALRDSDRMYQQLRNDLQRLNDLYNAERRQHVEAQNANVQLESELSRLQKESAFLQRETEKVGELRKKVLSYQSQLSSGEEALDEVKRAAQKNILALKSKLDESEQEKAGLYLQLNSHGEELNSSRMELRKVLDERQGLLQALAGLQEGSLQEQEKQRYRFEEMAAKEDKRLEEIAALHAELRRAREQLSAKAESSEQLTAKLRALSDSLQAERAEGKLRASEMADSMSSLQSQNRELERQAAEFGAKLGQAVGESVRVSGLLDGMKVQLGLLQDEKEGVENRMAQQIHALTEAREQAVSAAMASQHKADAVAEQLRELQQRHWNELQRAKEADSQLAEETDALQQELHEKTLQLIALEAEKKKLEEQVHGDMASATQLSGTLRG